ncbi:DNA-binding protein [Escherichia coli]|nr:DNA-binding protein [Escherichia coli]MBZ8430987.1 DNA-binding protein [Escherichia coli]
MKMNDSDIIGIGAVAAMFGVHRQTIAKWLDSIPGFPQPFTPQVKGIHQKWYRHEIIEYINKNKGRAK